MKRLCLGVFLALALSSACGYESLHGPTELRYWDKERAHNGYTLFAAHGKTYLIDMEGSVVHTWRIGTNPRFLENGNLLDATRDDPSGFQGFQELDWDGNVVWEYQEKRENYAPHHDWVRIFNKKLNAPTTLYIANRSITREQAIAAGCDPDEVSRGGGREGRGRGRRGGRRDGGVAQVDAIVEVDMDGNIVWEWWFFDHVVQNIDPTKPNYVSEGKTITDYPGRLNLNLPGKPVRGDWLHCNSLDYNAELDQIVVNSVQGEFYVIDHGNTFIAGDPKRSIALAAGEKGDFLYRFGDPARYQQGDPPSILENWTKSTTGHKQIGGSHDVQWTKPGLPGAGHFLIFNNGQYLFEATPQSYIFEINGFLDADGRDTGNYVNPPDAGYHIVEYPHDTHKTPRRISNHIVWTYSSKSNQGFFSHIGSGCQRLPNGNTLICSDTEGHIFEVTSEGDLVWEYINPVTKEHGTVKVMPDSLPMTNAVFRAYRYSPDHPALKGKDLTPKGTITGAFAQGPSRRGDDRRPPRDDQRRGRPREDSERRRDRDDRQHKGVVAPGATLVGPANGFQFTEGPAADTEGNVFFTDIPNNRIHKWSVDGRLSTFLSDSGGANGLFFDRDGNLLACEGDNGRLVSIDPQGNVTVLADQYDGKRFNKPNDLWIDPKGGVYFSDPIYGRAPRMQDGEHVYYLTPDRKKVIRVIDDMVRPNGIIGTPDGRTLYVTDHGAKQTYVYDTNDDGTLSNKRLFTPIGSDGMTIDNEGNIYLTEEDVVVYDSAGNQIAQIDVPNRPTNVCFGGRDGRTLFITARTSIYAIPMSVQGVLPFRRPSDGRKDPDRPETRGTEGGSGPPSGPRDRGPGRSRNPVILALDTDGDGEISADEIQDSPAALRKLDKNGDGIVSREEMRPEGGGPERGGKSGPERDRESRDPLRGSSGG